jgi:hypothetical protein
MMGLASLRQGLPRVFERFFQVETHLTRRYGGMGLGLAVAKAMIELHGGRIWAESETGRGSTFTFLLPLEQSQMETVFAGSNCRMIPPIRHWAGRSFFFILFYNCIHEPQFLVFGQLTREYPPASNRSAAAGCAGRQPALCGGGAEGVGVRIGLVGRVGNDYPREWLNECMSRGFDTSGIRILPINWMCASSSRTTDRWKSNRINPVSHFARRGMTFPKSLLGYQPDRKPDEGAKPERNRYSQRLPDRARCAFFARCPS